MQSLRERNPRVIACVFLICVLFGFSRITMKQTNNQSPEVRTQDVVDPTQPQTPVRHKDLFFFIIGDWGTGPLEKAREVAAALATMAAQRRPTAVISTGDNIYDPTVKNATDVQFLTHFEQIYGAESLAGVPWLLSLGNHDHETPQILQAQLDYGKAHPHRWSLPAPYYRRRYGEQVEFFVLDSYELMLNPPESGAIDEMSKAQLQWLDGALQSSTAPWKLIIAHRPVYSGGHAHGNSLWLQQNLVPLMKKWKVQAHFCGDDHSLQVLRADGIAYFVSGAGAKRSKSDTLPETVFRGRGKPNGFMTVRWNSEVTMTVDVISSEGALLHSEIVNI